GCLEGRMQAHVARRQALLAVGILISTALGGMPPNVGATGYADSYEGALVGDGDGASFALQGGYRRWVPDVGTYWTIYFMNGQRAFGHWTRNQVYEIPEGAHASAPSYPPQDEGALVHQEGSRTSYLLQRG